MKKILFSILIFVFTQIAEVNAKIVYIDINKILNDSNVGKKTIKKLDIELKENIKKFNKIEKSLKEEENDIISKKNIMPDDDYNKKIIDLRNKINNYRRDRSLEQNSFNEKKQSLTNKFISIINPIIANYASENDISIVIRKEHMIVGKIELDISTEILKLVNENVKEIK